MLQVNVVALTMLTKRLLPAMIERRHGRVLNVASTAAFQPGPLMAVYYASKAYVLSFSEALSNETSGTGVTVTLSLSRANRDRFPGSRAPARIAACSPPSASRARPTWPAPATTA